MKKVNALVIGIVFLFASMVPITSAFADSDPGLSSQVWANTFGWYTGFPMVDSFGYMDMNDWSITYRSNGQDASSPGAGDVVYLYQPGDYVEYSFNGYDLLSNYHSSLWGIQFGQNPSYSSGGLDDLKYILKQGYNSSDAFYQYIRGFQYDNREIDWAHIIFSYPGTGITSIRIEYNGTPTIWNCIYIKFNGWRNSPVDSSLTTADMLTLQNNIISAFNVARLADIIELDSSDVDLSTLEATTNSILQKLANVPDIISYIDQIETIDTNILNAINQFYNYFNSMFIDFTYTAPSNYYYHDANGNVINSNTTLKECYLRISYKNLEYVNDHYYRILLSGNDDIHVEYSISSGSLTYTYKEPYYFTQYFNNNIYLYIYIYSPYMNFGSPNFIIFHFTSDSDFSIYRWGNTATYIGSYEPLHNTTIFERIWFTLNQLLSGNYNSETLESISQTTDTVTDQVTDIVDFEETYNDNLQQNATQIDVSSYEIQQTQGMSFMRTYTELNFDRMQNFRILFLTPLILALAAFFLRRKT